MNQSKCSRCGGEMAPGALKQLGRTSGDVRFQLDEAPFFSLVSSDVEVSASLCLDCGFVELWGDREKARRVLRRNG